ncbi:MAG: nuclear transport factor 2 family protein [Bacteroidetes bacterium]|nr:nuclear transport factor 2 family protein [Bacteroidota bacterium]
MKNITSYLFLVILAVQLSYAQTDQEGVRSAVEDYLEGLYQAAPERIERSVSKSLVKFGYWRDSPEKEYVGYPMSYDQLMRLAASWNVGNKMKLDDSTPREIAVLDVLNKTAVAKLTAHWGIDYFQLEKVDGKWMIRHIIWQAHPGK